MSENKLANDMAELAKVMAQLKAAFEAFAPALRKICAELVSTVTVFYVRLQRIYLAGQLMHWMPDRGAWWIAEHWPEPWLPAIDFERLIEGEQ